MKFPSYAATPGLDRFPSTERFAVYRATHQRLMSEDTVYRRRHSSYIAAVVCLAIVPVAGWLAILYLAVRQQLFQNERIGSALPTAA
jgi:hypothetical protein